MCACIAALALLSQGDRGAAYHLGKFAPGPAQPLLRKDRAAATAPQTPGRPVFGGAVAPASPGAGHPGADTALRAEAMGFAISPVAADKEHWMDFLKFNGSAPGFDVVEMTKKYSAAKTYEETEEYYDDEYVFRGSIVGPITAKDVRETQKGFNILGAYPDLQREAFGFTIDPENPYRCFYFERWRGTNTGGIKLGTVSLVGGLALPATGKVAAPPMHVVSLNWNPKGKIIYQGLSPPLDRFEGNTMGHGAVFGLLEAGGVPLPLSSVGNPVLSLNQKYVAPLIQQKVFSDDADLPSWWKSKSKGADANDM